MTLNFSMAVDVWCYVNDPVDINVDFGMSGIWSDPTGSFPVRGTDSQAVGRLSPCLTLSKL